MRKPIIDVLVLLAALYFAGPARAGNVTPQDFLSMPEPWVGSYLAGYIRGRTDGLVVALVTAGRKLPGSYCHELTIGEISALMLMSIRRSDERSHDMAVHIAYQQVCGQ